MTSASLAEHPAPDSPFELQAVEVMRGLRAAFGGLIDGFPQPPRRAADLARVVGVNRMVAWQFHRIATAPNPLAAGVDMPGKSAVEQILKGAKSAGVPRESIARVRKAMVSFEDLVKRHAGDRTAFATMVGSVAGGEAEAIDIKTRRQSFRTNSQMWGVQIKTQLACVIYRPGKTPRTVDQVSIRGLREIRRLRADTPFSLGSQRVRDSHKQVVEVRQIGGESQNSPLGPDPLIEFCTQPCPKLMNKVQGDFIQTYLPPAPLGSVGAQTLYFANISREVDCIHPQRSSDQLHRVSVLKPVQALVMDTLLYRGMFGEIHPEVKVVGSLDHLGVTDPDDVMMERSLPIPAEVHNLGTGLGAIPTPHVPRYADMVESVCGRLGWDPDDFDVYRCIVEYPMLSSVVVIRFPLPEKGSW